jgi:hypothetical protein
VLLLNASPGENGGKSVLAIAKTSFEIFGGRVFDSFRFPTFNVEVDNLDNLGKNDSKLSAFKEVIARYDQLILTEENSRQAIREMSMPLVQTA